MPDSSFFNWPDGARAAVSLTYDDAVPTQRLHAAPQLRARGLRGTFFLTGASADLRAQRDAWRALVAEGHELASHTMHHPCDCRHDWVPKGRATGDYDLQRMQAELVETLELLDGLGAPRPFTFAYPCGETEVGAGTTRASYVPLVAELFLAARSVEPEIADPRRVALELVPAHDGAKTIDELSALLDRAESERGWLVLLFHGVGGDHMSVPLETHAALLEQLSRRRDALWTERFGVVASHVARERRRV